MAGIHKGGGSRSIGPERPLEMDAEPDHDHVERRTRALVDAGCFARAAAQVLGAYGSEIFGFLLAVADGPVAAHEVYAEVSETVAAELSRFQWGCRLRVFGYLLARRALAGRRARSESDATRPPLDAGLPDPTVTISRRPKAERSKVAGLRRQLSAEERELLVLRVSRGLGWRELAVTSLGDRAAPLEIEREAMRLCDQLAGIRATLARAAIARKLLEPS